MQRPVLSVDLLGKEAHIRTARWVNRIQKRLIFHCEVDPVRATGNPDRTQGGEVLDPLVHNATRVLEENIRIVRPEMQDLKPAAGFLESLHLTETSVMRCPEALNSCFHQRTPFQCCSS